MKCLEKYISIDDNVDGVTGLTDELFCYYLSEVLRKKKRNILLVTSSLFEANKYYQMVSDYTDNIYLFPMDDFLTSEALAISPEFKITRLETMLHSLTDTPKIVITNLMGYLRYLPTPDVYQNHFLTIQQDCDYQMNELIQKLYQMGYQRETLVNKTGEMAVRGFVIDVFPMGMDHPVRIEFWGDTVDSIRTFEVDNQHTLEKFEEVIIYPNTEFLTSTTVDLENIHQRLLPEYGNVSTISDYLKDCMVVYADYQQLKVSYENLLDEIYHYNISMELDGNTKYMHDFYMLDAREKHHFYYMGVENIANRGVLQQFDTKDISMFPTNMDEIRKYLLEKKKQGMTIVLALKDRYQVNHVIESLEEKDILFVDDEHIVTGQINAIIFPLTKGFQIQDFMVLTEHELFHKKIDRVKYKTNFKFGTKIRDINKLQIGDYIVHNVHGIGRYIGLKTLLKNGLQKDYLMVEYKDHDKLYIPVEKIDSISKYSSSEGSIPKLNKLGGSEWAKTKLRVRKKIENIAGQLLEMYALREAKPGFAFLPDDEDQIAFEKDFPYEETTDQLKVAEEIKKDMESPHSMDRLLCGDVGFGKTEVAFRAMFKAVLSGKQVAFLCPTTILSKQHYQNAINRFSNFPVRIVLLNRFVSSKEAKQILDDLKEGKVDILIGTHRILSDDVQFKDLGLLVIDEEQRFGVKHKEKIKQYRNTIDVLTLSATPIPRTLQLSMAGIRSLSLIETPPVNRYPVQTYVVGYNKPLLKDAIYKELSRNGQVFILYNHIDDMHAKVAEIERLAPDAKVISAHGRMDKNELEDVMQKFVDHEYDILVCTTIIETGIDIPNVNTLIIMGADHFGLSQLYQIRGRVGRSDKIAYCYLMYNASRVLSETAKKRLNVIKEFTELGSGFSIAMRDLSIRGAGDILGSEQAGFIDTIGIELFLKMLNDEIKKLQGKAVNREEEIQATQPLLDVSTTISDNYVEEEELKIEIHKQINTIDSYDKLKEVRADLEDRFGHITDDMLIYMYEEWFEKIAEDLGIRQVRQTKNFIEVTIPAYLLSKLKGDQLFFGISNISKMFRFAMRGKNLIITLDTVKLEKHFIYYLIEMLKIIQEQVRAY